MDHMVEIEWCYLPQIVFLRNSRTFTI